VKSLRTRLLLAVLAGIAVVLAVSGVAVHGIRKRQLRREFDESLERSARSIGAMVMRARRRPEGLTVEEIQRIPANRLRPDAQYQVWFDDTRPRRRGPRDRPPPRRPIDEPQSHIALRSPGLGDLELPRLEGSHVFREVELPEGVVGRALGMTTRPGARANDDRVKLTVVVAAPTTEIDAGLAKLAALLIGTAIAGMGLAVAISWFAVNHGLRPLKQLAGRISTLDETRLDERLPDEGLPTEIAPIAGQLNGLMRRLASAFERERGLTADVAHELRTPLAGVRSILEVTLAHPRDTEEYREALTDTLAVTMSIQSVVERLLTLARLESGQTKVALAPIALRPAIDTAWRPLADEADARGVSLAVDFADSSSVDADPALLEIGLTNALGNAVTYATEGAAIDVDFDGETLTLANPTDEPPDDPEAMFDRFRRGDAARTGTGLRCGVGLTLVRRAMEAVGGTAEAVIDDGRFVLSLSFNAG